MSMASLLFRESLHIPTHNQGVHEASEIENSPSTTQNSLAKFHLFHERALLFHNNYPATLHCSPATTIFLMKTLHNYIIHP